MKSNPIFQNEKKVVRMLALFYVNVNTFPICLNQSYLDPYICFCVQSVLMKKIKIYHWKEEIYLITFLNNVDSLLK